ncbi:unnamed protein product [Orchesella dallaii]|uniref:GT23 domain-containing protein n=1 Tax=Orchesella dallaii TaxID=48710 RepID=A0ABP1R0T0_9HEXA
MMSRARFFFIIKVSCVLVILCCVILQVPLNLITTREWNPELPHSSVILSEKEKLYEISNPPIELAEMKLYIGLKSSGGDVEVDNFQKRRIDLEDNLNTLSRIVKEYAVSQGFNSSVQNSSEVLQTPELINRERAELADLVQGRIKALQNPDDCAKAKKLVCTVDKKCGFGCIVHHVAYCLITGYHTNRTLILNLKLVYDGQSWNETFLPLSSTCLDGSGDSYGVWGGGGNNVSAQVVSVGTFQAMQKFKKAPWAALHPTTIPKEFLSRLRNISNDPLIWWVGQFVTYAMRLTPEMEKIVENERAKMRKGITPRNSSKSSIIPIGLHVRRTDKLIREAASYPLKAYLSHVTRYLKAREKIERKSITGRIFLASDEPEVIKEARNLEKRTKRWKIQANETIALAAEAKKRLSNGILGILIDVMLLADCEFVVCTFSSNVCRLVAELKEAEKDLGEEIVSVDDPYNCIFMRRG